MIILDKLGGAHLALLRDRLFSLYLQKHGACHPRGSEKDQKVIVFPFCEVYEGQLNHCS